MKYTTSLICLAVIAASAECASINDAADLNRTTITFGLFRKIPFVNEALNSVFPSRESSTTRGPTNMLDTLRNMFDIPDAASLVPSFPPFAHESSSKSIPEILGLYNDPSSRRIPGLTPAIQLARNRLQVALNITGDLNSGIKQAIAEASHSPNPLVAIRTIVATVIKTYTTVAANCPFLVVARRVLQEGIRLAEEIAQSAGNIYFGTTTTVAATDSVADTSTVAIDADYAADADYISDIQDVNTTANA